jgi:hypothetical protein
MICYCFSELALENTVKNSKEIGVAVDCTRNLLVDVDNFNILCEVINVRKRSTVCYHLLRALSENKRKERRVEYLDTEVFYDVIPCRMVNSYLGIGGEFCLFLCPLFVGC